MPFTKEQQRALSIAPRVSAPLSLLGSAFIVKSTLEEMMNKEATTYHRLLFAMSCVDVMSSFAYSFSTSPIPKGTPGVWGAAGTTATCTAQGFFVQLGNSVPVYNGFLAIYLLLITRYKWSEKRTRTVEPFMHIISLAFGGGGAAVGLPLKLHNNANLWCWFAPFPLNCKDSLRYGDEANCIRGDNSWVYRYAFAYGPVWFSFLVASFSLLLVYLTVLQKEKDVDKYQSEGTVLRTQSRRVAWQSLWYLLAFFVTWFPGSITRLLQTIPGTKGHVYFPIIMAMSICLPMQGLLNFLVYFRAKYVKYRRDNPGSSVSKALWMSTLSKRNRPSSTQPRSSNADLVDISLPEEGRKSCLEAVMSVFRQEK